MELKSVSTFNFRKCFSTRFLTEKLRLLLDNETLFKIASDNRDKDDDVIFALMSTKYKKMDDAYFNINKIKYLDNIPGMSNNYKVLDFGGSNGSIAAAIAKYYKIETVDIVDVHRPEYAVKDSHIKYKQISNNKLPYANDTFDVITCFMVLHHISPNDIAACIEEIHRCCKKYLLIQEHDCSDDMKYILDILHGLYIFVYKEDDYEKINQMSEYHAWYKSAGQFDSLFHDKFKLVKRFHTNKVQKNFVAVYEKV